MNDHDRASWRIWIAHEVVRLNNLGEDVDPKLLAWAVWFLIGAK